jgi:prevent-host-death family protein
MKTATIAYARNNLSALLRRVKRGETITILERTTPIARLEPIPSTGDVDWDRKLDDLERRGIIRRGSGKVPDWILKEPPPKPRRGFSITQTLIDMRNEDR